MQFKEEVLDKGIFEEIVWAITARFHFSPNDMSKMKLRRFGFWYRGHVHIHNEENDRLNSIGGKRG